MAQSNRTHTCGELRKEHIGNKITLSGWVHRRRDLGGLIFIDLRDRYGLTQLIFDPEKNPQLHEKASDLRSEWVITVKGIARHREKVNPDMPTGYIEIEVSSLEILNQAQTPPFSISDEEEANDEIRLKYRHLDIRRGRIIDLLRLRHKASLELRSFLDSQNFLEIQTPILGKSTPETGARDYIVPSRIYPGNFFALPQSPQIYKQLLMMAGTDRYFQLAPCFRDEDLRADRQPEFTQVDIELSFSTQEHLMHMVERLITRVFNKCVDVTLPAPFRQMQFSEAVEKYGTDKPDLRFELPLVRIDELVPFTEFAVFKSASCVKGLCVKGGAELSRKEIDRYTGFVGDFGLKGLAWTKWLDGKAQGNIAKFLPETVQEKLQKLMTVEEGDLLFFAADSEACVNKALDNLRRLIGKERNLIPPSTYAPVWITDFPLFSIDEHTGALQAEHHPFTSPHPDDLHLLDSDPLAMRAAAYDIVINGYELGGGSVRIHDAHLQERIFQTLKLSDSDINDRFGFFIGALKQGTPPHLGIALGLDRFIMLLGETDNIRDVIAFPKTTKASDLLLDSPSPVAPTQLEELQVKIAHEPEEN